MRKKIYRQKIKLYTFHLMTKKNQLNTVKIYFDTILHKKFLKIKPNRQRGIYEIAKKKQANLGARFIIYYAP